MHVGGTSSGGGAGIEKNTGNDGQSCEKKTEEAGMEGTRQTHVDGTGPDGRAGIEKNTGNAGQSGKRKAEEAGIEGIQPL